MSSHSVTLYGLSTCVHCRHAREFFEEHEIPFTCVYVDTLEGDERAQTIAAVKQHNPRVSFPTIVIDQGAKVLIGFHPEELEENLL